MLLLWNKNIKKICILGNLHGLLQYLLLSSMNDICQTFFLTTFLAIPDSIKNRLGKNCNTIPKPRSNYFENVPFLNILIDSFRLFFDYRIFYPLRYPFTLNSKYEYWGHDHVCNAHCFFRNHPFRLLEDGTANYVPYPFSKPKQRFAAIKKLLAGRNYGNNIPYMGYEDRCTTIYLTGLSDKGDVLKDPRTRINSFEDMWLESSMEKREYINRIFGVSFDLIHECSKYKHILLTEPLSEEKILTEEEQIRLYKEIIYRIGEDGIVIKPHPRDRVNYSSHIPNVFVLNTDAPMQLLTLNGIRFETAYSIRSSAIFDFPYRIKVCVLGSEVHPVLFQKLPEWTSDKIISKITNKNVEVIKL